MAYRYPTDLPLEEIKLLVEHIRGRAWAKLVVVLEASWWVAGYAISKITPGAAGLPGDVDVPALLESLTMARGAAAVDALAAGLPWDRILMFVLELIRKLDARDRHDRFWGR